MIKYDTYKDSGIEWLGEIPEHWKSQRIKDVLSNSLYSIKTGPFGSQLKGNDLLDKGDFCVYSQRNVLDNQFKEFKYFVDTEKAKSLKSFNVLPRDILVTTRGTIGKCSLVPDEIKKGVLHPCLMALRLDEKLIDFNFFLFYINDSNIFSNYIKSTTATTTIEVIYTNTLKNFIQILPPLNEQTQIATYLDKKTNGIDRKIELLSKKISTYKELRKALIKETALKGLDKDVKLIDSNINWLGSYPAHWQLKRIKDIFTISRGRVIAKTELKDKGLYPVYSSQTQNNGELGCIDTFDFDTDLLTWTTDGANAGTVFKRAGKFSCTNICGTLIPIYKDKISLDYFVYSVQESATPNKRIDTNGAKIMSNEMSVIDIVVPPLEEQKAIANYLDEKTSKIDAIVNNIENQITHLKELRKALINDVVTGKIKVVK